MKKFITIIAAMAFAATQAQAGVQNPVVKTKAELFNALAKFYSGTQHLEYLTDANGTTAANVMKDSLRDVTYQMTEDDECVFNVFRVEDIDGVRSLFVLRLDLRKLPSSSEFHVDTTNRMAPSYSVDLPEGAECVVDVATQKPGQCLKKTMYRDQIPDGNGMFRLAQRLQALDYARTYCRAGR
jgi:hypothetical protein